jgi:hypothetical protein
MSQTSYAGIDYSLGRSNIDRETGIHYGVISQHSISGDALNEMEPEYGEPHCPKCGEQVTDTTEFETTYPEVNTEDWEQYDGRGCADYTCESCQHTIDSQDCFPDESQGFSYNSHGYLLTDCLNSDVFVLKSPFYTFAQFCSPCVPGAGNLDSPCEDGPKTYCLGHDWFEEGKAPYKVFKVGDGAEVQAE